MKFKFTDTATGEILQEWTFNPSQEKFWNSDGQVVLFSGGFGAGKSLMFVLKAVDLSLRYPKNYILMGRKTYPELRDTLIKEFFATVPDQLIADYQKAEGRVVFANKSEIIFRHLDTIAESEIKSLNLGAAFIDQAEEVSREVVYGLKGRLRREGIADKDRKIYMACNPALTWLYADFKQDPQPGNALIEASTLENKDHLPASYLETLLSYPESLKRQYVYGIWDADLLADKVVFAREYLEKMSGSVMEPLRTFEGLEIFREFASGHRYQMGIDCAEGGEAEITDKKKDSAAITIVDLTTEEEVGSWSGRIPPDATADKAARFVSLYQDRITRCLVVPEMNSMGLALVNRLRQHDHVRMFQREEYDKVSKEKMMKLGWRTTRQSKPLLVSRFQELLRLADPKVRSKKTFEEFKTFIYSDEARKSGMGAQAGFHDDRLMSLLLAFWQQGPVQPSKILKKEEKSTEEFLKEKKGRLYISIKPYAEIEKRWTTV